MEPGPFAGFFPKPELHVELRNFRLEGAHERLAKCRALVWMNHALDVRAARCGRRAIVAKEADPAVAGEDFVRLGLVVPLGEVCAVQRELEAFLGLEERHFGTPLLRDVPADAAVAEQA